MWRDVLLNMHMCGRSIIDYRVSSIRPIFCALFLLSWLLFFPSANVEYEGCRSNITADPRWLRMGRSPSSSAPSRPASCFRQRASWATYHHQAVA